MKKHHSLFCNLSLVVLSALVGCSDSNEISFEEYKNRASSIFVLDSSSTYTMNQIMDYTNSQNTRFYIVEKTSVDLNEDIVCSERVLKSTSTVESTFRNQHYQETRTIFRESSEYLEKSSIHFFQSRYYSNGQLESGNYYRKIGDCYEGKYLNQTFHLAEDTKYELSVGWSGKIIKELLNYIMQWPFLEYSPIVFNDLKIPVDNSGAQFVHGKSLGYTNNFAFSGVPLPNAGTAKGNCRVNLQTQSESVQFILDVVYQTSKTGETNWGAQQYVFFKTEVRKTNRTTTDLSLEGYKSNDDIFKLI